MEEKTSKPSFGQESFGCVYKAEQKDSSRHHVSDEEAFGCATSDKPEHKPSTDTNAIASNEKCGCISVRIRRRIGDCFARYAIFATRRPLVALTISFALLVVCAPGILLLKRETKSQYLWVRGSYPWRAYERMDEEFSFNPRLTSVQLYFQAKPGRNLMDAAALREIGNRIDDVLSWKTDSGKGFSDLCENSWRGVCELGSVFHDFRTRATDLGVTLSSPSGMGEVEGLAQQLSQYCTDQTKCKDFIKPLEKKLLVTDQSSSAIMVQSLRFIMYLNRNPKDDMQDYQKMVLKETHGPTYDWSKDNLQTDNFYVLNYSDQAMDHEASRPAANEIHLMGIAFILMIFFVWLSIFAPTAPHFRTLLTLATMAVVLLSMVCSVGLIGYFGVPYTGMTSLVIFTLMGVSVDDIIVIVHSYDRLPGKPSVEKVAERVAKSLQESGPAITLTSLTSFVAFACAAFCSIPVVGYFCVTAALGIVFVFLLQITFFLPLFIIDERRRLMGRRECCFSKCLGQLPVTESSPSLCQRVIVAPSVGGGCGVMKTFAREVSSRVGFQIAMVFTFFVMCGLGTWGSIVVDDQSDMASYYVDGSFLSKYFDDARTFWSSPETYNLMIEHKGEGLFPDQRLAAIYSLFDDVAALDCTFAPHENWLKDFESYLNVSIPPGGLVSNRANLIGNPIAFGQKVSEFLDASAFQTPDGRLIIPWQHKRNVVLKGGEVKYSRLIMQYETDFSSQRRYVDNYEKSLRVVFPGGENGENGDFENPRVPNTFAYTWMYAVAVRDRDMRLIIFSNLGIACAGVAATIILMLNPLVGLFVAVLVAALDTIVIGLIALFGDKLDFVAFLCLSMTIGLVVDYSTHTSHLYITLPGSPNEKLYHAISAMGSSVLAGGGSTILGICVLAFAKSAAFRMFFKVLGSAIFMGTFVGISIGPVLLRVLHGVGLWLLELQKGKQEQTVGVMSVTSQVVKQEQTVQDSPQTGASEETIASI